MMRRLSQLMRALLGEEAPEPQVNVVIVNGTPCQPDECRQMLENIVRWNEAVLSHRHRIVPTESGWIQ